MVYETFLNQTASHIQHVLSDRCTVHLEHVRKNNGLVLDGICIRTPGEPVAPTIYLNSYYEAYQNGHSLSEIYEWILDAYKSRGSFSNLDIRLFEDFSNLEDKIIFRFINAQSNQELLKTIPSLPYLDLAVVFCIYLTDDANTQQMTALIQNSHLTIWGVSISHLKQYAEKNTPHLFPPSIKSLNEVLESFSFDCPVCEPEEPACGFPFYVLTNQTNLYGSSCMRYPGVLRNFADCLNTDLLILPSSIHEVLLTADSPDTDYELLSNMVLEINQSEVSVEDRLSNQIYRYSRRDDCVSIVSHGPESVGK